MINVRTEVNKKLTVSLTSTIKCHQKELIPIGQSFYLQRINSISYLGDVCKSRHKNLSKFQYIIKDFRTKATSISDDIKAVNKELTLSSRIYVVGGGIAGLLTCIALARKGYRIILYEKRQIEEIITSGTSNYSINLSAEAIKSLNQLGVDVGQDSVFKKYLRIDKKKNGVIKQTDLTNQPQLKSARAKWRHQIIRAIYDRIITSYSNQIELNFGNACLDVDFSQQILHVLGDQKIYDILLVCDGVNSKIRSLYESYTNRQIQQKTEHDYDILVIDDLPQVVDSPYVPKGETLIFLFNENLKDRAYITLWPNRLKSTYCLGTRLTTTGQNQSKQFKQIVKDFEEFLPQQWQDHLLETPNKTLFKTKLCVPSQLFGEKLIFMGDSGHPITNFSGMGAQLAIKDVQIFSDVIQNETSIDQILINYNQKRLSQVLDAQKFEQLLYKAIVPSSVQPFYLLYLIFLRFKQKLLN